MRKSPASRPGIAAVTPLDLEHYPYSQSLFALLVWGVLVGLVYRAIVGSTGRAALTLFVLVVSHWVLDLVVHRPDMPLAPGFGPKLGLAVAPQRMPAIPALQRLLQGLFVSYQ